MEKTIVMMKKYPQITFFLHQNGDWWKNEEE
jgi:hypothetical protein